MHRADGPALGASASNDNMLFLLSFHSCYYYCIYLDLDSVVTTKAKTTHLRYAEKKKMIPRAALLCRSFK